MKEEIKNKNEKPAVVGLVHVILYQSYLVFFLAVILGVIFDFIFPFNLFNGLVYQYLGLGMIFVGSLIVYWSQKTTSYSKRETTEKRDINFFRKGPYRYVRNPTNFGLTIMLLGFGILINSLFSVIFLIINYFISKFIFIKKQEDILRERYGPIYEEYTKQVKDWL